MMPLHNDLFEFLKLLNKHGVRYLVIGGTAVIYYGVVRNTGDLDVWVPDEQDTAERLVAVYREFGFDLPGLRPEIFRGRPSIVRIGLEPNQIEVGTGISGVDFDECYAAREVADFDGIPVTFISLAHLKQNKQAAGRLKDLSDLDNLP